MKHFSLMLLGAVGAFFVLSPAQAADFRVIQWNITKACQIYDFGWGLRPIPPNYRVLTRGAAELRRRAQGERRLGTRGPLFDLAGNPPCCVNMLLGAGLPGLLLASGGLLAWWRRKRKTRRLTVV